MKNEKLLLAFGKIADDIIEEAEDSASLKYISNYTTEKSFVKRPKKKLAMLLIAVTVLLLGSFVTAMAVNEDFREAVFSFFNIKIPDMVLPVEDEPKQSHIVENIHESKIDDVLTVEYIRIDGNFDFGNGVIYLYKNAERSSLDFYAIERDKLIALDTNHVDMQYEWRGVTYEICFDWCIYDGINSTHGLYKESSNDAYWVVSQIDGRTDMVMLTLSAGRHMDYTEHKLFLYLDSESIIDPFEGCGVDKLNSIINITFSPDMTKAIITCENEETVWYCDMNTKHLMTIENFLGKKADGSFFIDDDTIVYYSMDNSYRFTYYMRSLTTETEKMIIEDTPMFGVGGITWGIKPTENRYMLLVHEDQSVYVLDFQTGERMMVDGFVYPVNKDTVTFPNSNGSKILFVTMDKAVTGLGVSQIGVLDLEHHTFTLLDREGYETRYESSIGWFDDSRVVIWANTEDYGYLYIYTIENKLP